MRIWGNRRPATEGRDDFTQLAAEVALGHVGIIFGWEVSRLARNNADWYQLLDLAAVVGTLIADIEGVYDPRSYNDRLLLGLKGTMSEAELHMMRQRLNAGRLSKVERGEYIQHLPTGLVRLRMAGWRKTRTNRSGGVSRWSSLPLQNLGVG